MVTFKGNFTNENLKGDTGRKDPVDEVIDILNQIGQDDSTVYTGDTGAQAMSRPRPQSAAPVNVGMMPERRGNVNIPMGQSTFKRMQPGQEGRFLSNAGLSNQMDPQDNLGSVQSPFTTALNLDPDVFDQDTGDIINYPVGGGRGGPFDGGNFLTSIPFNLAAKNAAAENFRQQELDRMQGTPSLGISSLGDVSNMANISSGYPMKPDPGYEAALQKATPSGLGGIFQGILGSLTGSNPAVYMQTDEYGDPMGGGNYAVGRTFENADTARRLGFIPVGRDAGGNIVYDVDPAVKASQARQEEYSRKDREDRERAALAAQQQQSVDPCPEGYRMDPVSKVCVPTDDTTDTDPVKRTYDTMTRPEPNYTAATGFTVPSINLPDIFGG